MSKIGIFGDSYADPNPGEPRPLENWMTQLSNITSTQNESFGISGISIWKTYEIFLENYKKYSHIVFVYSDVNRIHHISDNFLGKNYLKPDALSKLDFYSDKDKSKIKKIIETYWYFLQNDKFDLFVYQNVFNSVNKICKENNIKLVNIFPFECIFEADQLIDLELSTGDSFLGLQEISREEADIGSNPLSMFSFDPRDCHLTKENNEVLAKLIAKSFDSSKNLVYNIGDSPKSYGFVFNKSISDRYFKGI